MSRLKRLTVSYDLLLGLFRGEHSSKWRVIKDEVPPDAVVTKIENVWPSCLELTIESKTFPDLSGGVTIPSLQPELEKME